MQEARALVRDLVRWGRPAPFGRFLSACVHSLELFALLLPVAALIYRLRHGIPREPIALLLATAPWGLALPALALARLVVERRDPLGAARRADRLGDGEERFLTAADAEARGRTGAFLPLVVAQARRRLAELPRGRGSLRPRRLPSLRLIGLALLLALAFLFVPAAARGLLGEADPERSADGGAIAGEDGAGEGKGAGPADAFGAKVSVEARTDARMYALGQEINLTLSLKTDEPLPAGVPLAVVLRLNGQKRLPLDDILWELPTEPGTTLEATVPLRDRLKEIEAYRRGLLTIESFVFPAEERPDLRGHAEANRVIVQISENQKNAQARAPRSAKKEPKPQKKPSPKKEKKERPNQPNQKKRKPKPEPQPGGGPGPPPPEDIEAKKSVVEPLFSGDQTKKRRKRVYDRDLERADPLTPPPAAKPDRDRAYEARKEVEIIKGAVPPRDRARVKRYFERIRPGGKER